MKNSFNKKDGVSFSMNTIDNNSYPHGLMSNDLMADYRKGTFNKNKFL